jgi:uncharacterized protein YrrD
VPENQDHTIWWEALLKLLAKAVIRGNTVEQISPSRIVFTERELKKFAKTMIGKRVLSQDGKKVGKIINAYWSDSGIVYTIKFKEGFKIE